MKIDHFIADFNASFDRVVADLLPTYKRPEE